MRHTDGRCGMSTALLILNEDMPYLVDSFVMALRRQRVVASGVMNAVLPVRRDANGVVTAVGEAGAPLESYVLCLLAEDLPQDELDALVERLQMVARDAAIVHRDAVAMRDRMTAVAAAAAAQRHRRPARKSPPSSNGPRTKASSPSATPTTSSSRACANSNATSRAASACCRTPRTRSTRTCLQNIPGDFEILSKRDETLSIVKADVAGTLHRDQPLDFIGVRDTDAQGNTIGEHCFVGLFTRAATSTPLARLPFARGRVAKVLGIAGVRQEGFRAEKFLEILESLPRTEALEADPEWLAQVCSAVVSLYKQPRAKVFARRDVYAPPPERAGLPAARALQRRRGRRAGPGAEGQLGRRRRALADPGRRRPAGPRLPDRRRPRAIRSTWKPTSSSRCWACWTAGTTASPR